MGQLIVVDFLAGKVISRTRYCRSADVLHREALARFAGKAAEI